MRAALGFRAHSGWAALVAITGPPERVILRQRIVIADPKIPGSKQPFHAAEELFQRYTESTRRLSREAIQSALDELKSYEIRSCGIVLSNARPLPPIAAIRASHVLTHTADGEFFRTALIEASEHCGLRITEIKERDLIEKASTQLRIPSSELESRLIELGKPLGAPWTQDQKYAALAAWLAL
jgi:hypothetical protein